MSNDDYWDRHRLKVAALEGIVAPGDHGVASWAEAVKQLEPDSKLNREAVICMCGVETNRALKNREKKFIPLPWKRTGVLNKQVIALKKMEGKRLRARLEAKGEKLPEDDDRMVKTRKSYKFVFKWEAERWLKDFERATNSNQKRAAVARSVKKKRGGGPLSEEEILNLRIDSLIEDFKSKLKHIRTRVVALIDPEGNLLAFTRAHPISAQAIANTLVDGGQIVSMTLHEAVTKRSWVNPSEREPWAQLYRHILEESRKKVAVARPVE